jgi:hypothetical protein
VRAHLTEENGDFEEDGRELCDRGTPREFEKISGGILRDRKWMFVGGSAGFRSKGICYLQG